MEGSELSDAMPPAGALEHVSIDQDLHPVPNSFYESHPSRPHLDNFEQYRALYAESIKSPDTFWARTSRKLLYWHRDFETTVTGSFAHGNTAWFLGGRLNASYNCIDRHAHEHPDRPAIIFEADLPGKGRSISYAELLQQTSQLAWFLRDLGVRKGDTVAIYLPMVPEAIVAFLACARIGAIHSVVFAGFSSDSLRDRILDAGSRVVITSDEGRRGGKIISTKKIVNEALSQCSQVEHCIVLRNTGVNISLGWKPGRDVWWHERAVNYPPYFEPDIMASEDPLFLLYTSGSTGKPKGIVHSTAGYLVGAAATGKYVFDLHAGDVFFCGGDIGWITGHTYVVYAPLLLGVTTVVFEGTPTYPSPSRYWDIIDRQGVTHFYVAPTALRLLKRAGDEHITAPMEKLRVLASVGEPIAAEVWKWYNDSVGRGRAHVIDTYWQTETGSHIICPLAGITPTKPGSASLPFFGIDPVIIDPVSGEEKQGSNVEGVLAIRSPWPSMARSIWKAHERYLETYMKVYPGYYFTGDGAGRDHGGHYWIRGRVDDVVNVSGHRLSTAEIEAALLEHAAVGEAAVVGVTDDLTGQMVNAFIALKKPPESVAEVLQELKMQVRKSIGPFATPKMVFLVEDLPKTRSGKIMRRILRKIAADEQDSLGDVSTVCVDARVVQAYHSSPIQA